MDSKIEKIFYDYLVAHGFPSSTIVFDPAFHSSSSGSKYRPDFAILDHKTNEPLVIFEVKGLDDPNTIKKGLQQIQTYIRASKDRSLRAYLVTPAKDGQTFNFYTTDEQGEPKLVPPIFLQPAPLSTARLSEKKESLAEEKQDTIDRFMLVCVVAAITCVFIAITDFVFAQYEIVVLTTERLALLGASVVLVVLPFIQTFKALGVEIERFRAKQNE